MLVILILLILVLGIDFNLGWLDDEKEAFLAIGSHIKVLIQLISITDEDLILECCKWFRFHDAIKGISHNGNDHV